MFSKLVITISFVLTFVFSAINNYFQIPFLINSENSDEVRIAEFIGEEKPTEIDNLTSSAVSIIAGINPNFIPIRDWGIENPEISLKAAIIFSPERNKILFEKNAEQVLSIASLTKLMTALVVLENIDLEETVVISENAILTPSLLI